LKRDVALVLSGGGVNAVLMEVGFLQRLRRSELWPRIGWIYGTSAGALAGTLAALDRVDDLEEFLMAMRPEDTFRPHRLWQLPLLGLHDYTLPRTIASRIGEPLALALALRESPIELVVIATDVTGDDDPEGTDALELAYSSRTAEPEIFAQAVLASAAISALVLPLRVGDRIATDGGWVRNFPLGYAYQHPEVKQIVAFRYLPRYGRFTSEPLVDLRRKLARFGRVPPVRAIIRELEIAEERSARGEPAHWVDMIARLMRVSILRNSVLEERQAQAVDDSVRELADLRRDVLALVGRRRRLAQAVERRFDDARFPFRSGRDVPRITVRASSDEVSLEQGLRSSQPWTDEAKRALIERGYRLTDEALRRESAEESAA
jgi:predicted acylesterase/phospholipase RssA